MVILRFLLFIVFFYGVQGCGQTGPLYLPGTPPPVYVPDEEK
jgi:predicted small lipoprotein YifL